MRVASVDDRYVVDAMHVHLALLAPLAEVRLALRGRAPRGWVAR